MNVAGRAIIHCYLGSRYAVVLEVPDDPASRQATERALLCYLSLYALGCVSVNRMLLGGLCHGLSRRPEDTLWSAPGPLMGMSERVEYPGDPAWRRIVVEVDPLGVPVPYSARHAGLWFLTFHRILPCAADAVTALRGFLHERYETDDGHLRALSVTAHICGELGRTAPISQSRVAQARLAVDVLNEVNKALRTP